MKQSQIRKMIQKVLKESMEMSEDKLREDTDAFGDDNRQFNMSFSFSASNKNDVVRKFNNAKKQHDYWSAISKIADWIENPGFNNSDEAFYWLENMYNASKINPGEAVAFHYSPTGWILAAKENGEFDGRRQADSSVEQHNKTLENSMHENKYIGTAGNIKVVIKPAGFISLETSSDELSLDRRQFKQILKLLKDIDWFSDNLTEWVTGNELDVLANAANDINRDIFNGRGQIDGLNYRMAVRDPKDEALKKLKNKTRVIPKAKGFSAKEDQAKQYFQLPDYNVSLSVDTYKVSRATIFQFASFDGELPKSKGLY